MSIIYVISDYGRLIKRGEVLQLRRGDDLLKTIFPFKTEQIVVIGRIEITSAAINLLMRHRIDTVFLHRNGRFNGKFAFATGKNVFLRRKQFQSLEDEKFCLETARAVVNGKLRNQLTFMQRTMRTKKVDARAETAQRELKQTLHSLAAADNLASIRGYEGYGARSYFSVFRQALKPDWAVFNGRSLNPPRDNVNSVLSFLYTLIFYRVDAALESVGLDPYVGYLHQLNYGKPALAFDLVEEFRVPLGDMLTVSLFNLGVLSPGDFDDCDFSEDGDFPLATEEESQPGSEPESEKRGVLLTKEGLRKVITQFEKKLDTPFFYPPLEARITYKKLFFEQARHFRRVLSGEEATYRPFQIK
jgi:CRISPR-associated protein Cas1